MQQFDDTDPHQMFQISRCWDSDQDCVANHPHTTGYSHDDVFVIRSVLDTNHEVFFSQCQVPRLTSYISDPLLTFEDSSKKQWKLSAFGSLESIGCPDEDLLDVSTWRVTTNNVVLLKAGHHDPPTQMWSPVFAGTGYNLALLPGFRHNLVLPGFRDPGCLTSSYDRSLAKSAMRSCDESMSYLLGMQVSVGRLKAIADLVTNDSSRMPGYCCLDDAANSLFFGYAVSVNSS